MAGRGYKDADLVAEEAAAAQQAQEAQSLAERLATPAQATSPAHAPHRPASGQGGSGGGGGGAAAPAPAAPSQDQLQTQQIDDFVRSNYPQMAWALDDAELGPVLRSAAQGGWDSSKLQGALEATTWWKTHAASAREWQQLQAEDPAEVGRRVDARELDIRLATQKLGLNLGDDVLRNLATQSLQYAWSDNELRANLGQYVHYTPGQQLTGDLGAEAQKLKAAASGDYYLDVGDDAAFSWAKDIYLGNKDEASWQAYLQTQAQSKWASISKYIAQGITPKQFFDPYVQQAAKVLEVPPAQVNIADDPKFQKMTSVAGSDGTLRPMTLWEAGQYLRGLPDFRNTQGGNAQAASLSQFITDKFGATA